MIKHDKAIQDPWFPNVSAQGSRFSNHSRFPARTQGVHREGRQSHRPRPSPRDTKSRVPSLRNRRLPLQGTLQDGSRTA